MPRRPRQFVSRVATALAAVIALFAVYRLYVTGNPVVAAAFAGGVGLAFFVYTARAAYTYRYLFPGLTGIAMFIVLPVLYTMWLGLTNYSSKNLLTFERATEVLLGEITRVESVRYPFELHADGDGFRIVLHTGEDDEDAAPEGGTAADNVPGSAAESAPGSAAESASGSAAESAPGSAAESAPGSAAESAPGSAIDAAGPATAPVSGVGSAAAPTTPPRAPRTPRVFVTPRLPLIALTKLSVDVTPLAASGFSPGEKLPLKDVIARGDAIKALTVRFPDGSAAGMEGLREFTPYQAKYQRNADGTLTDRKTKERITANHRTGFYETPDGAPVEPGFRAYVGGQNFVRVLTDQKFSGPFFRVFVWTVVFAALSVLFTAALGMLLAELLSWEGLRFRGLYRILLFLPYAVPSFISILVFKGLFNSNFGEINLILHSLLGMRPDWTGNAMLARIMILLVNTWLGYPYVMLLCMGLQKSIPRDLYEASALAGAGPLTNFFRITWPLIRKPLTPLLVSSFAFNFNNFVLIFLLTRGHPDFLDTSAPAGETDILVSYTYRIAFDDSGQNFGLAAAISTIIFVIVAILSVINLRLTRANLEERR
jgi:maltose/maltodextrin transport system permease protein